MSLNSCTISPVTITPTVTEEETRRLYKRFIKLDKNNSGSIDREEFLAIPQIANNPLAQRMIAIFDEDGGGDVDFKEFMNGLSAFSSRGNKQEKMKCKPLLSISIRCNLAQHFSLFHRHSYHFELLIVAFKVYDIDRDGYISNGELFLVLKMMVGNNLRDQQLQQIVDKSIMEADLDGDGKISFEEFMNIVEATDIGKQMTLTGV